MTLRLERLGPAHAAAMLAGQDSALAEEVVGGRWTALKLAEFLERAARWRVDGPIREFAAVDDWSAREDPAACECRAPALLGGGGLNLLDPGLERGQAALTYWVLEAHRARGHGHAIGAALVEIARADARIDQLVLRIAPSNTPSQSVASTLGARRIGTEERHPSDATRTVERWVLGLGAER